MAEDRGFLRPSTANRIKDVYRKRAFLTRLQLADPPRSIALDRNGDPLPAQDVFLVWANRAPNEGGSATTNVIGSEGELQAWQTLDARPGDLFMVDGKMAEITVGTRVERGVARASFRLTEGAA